MFQEGAACGHVFCASQGEAVKAGTPATLYTGHFTRLERLWSIASPQLFYRPQSGIFFEMLIDSLVLVAEILYNLERLGVACGIVKEAGKDSVIFMAHRCRFLSLSNWLQ